MGRASGFAAAVQFPVKDSTCCDKRTSDRSTSSNRLRTDEKSCSLAWSGLGLALSCISTTILTEISQLFGGVGPFERGRKVAGDTSSATGGAFWLITIASNLNSAELQLDPFIRPIRLERTDLARPALIAGRRRIVGFRT